jgi:hypothetical protein
MDEFSVRDEVEKRWQSSDEYDSFGVIVRITRSTVSIYQGFYAENPTFTRTFFRKKLSDGYFRIRRKP